MSAIQHVLVHWFCRPRRKVHAKGVPCIVSQSTVALLHRKLAAADIIRESYRVKHAVKETKCWIEI